MNVKKFIKECSAGYICAKCVIERMSEDDIVDMRAELQQHIVSTDKWSIVLSLIAIAIAMISLMMKTENSELIFVFCIILLPIIAFVVVSHIVELCKKSQYTKALSYLNDYEHIVTYTREYPSDKCVKRYMVDIQNIDKPR